MKIPGQWFKAKKNEKIIPEETEAGGHMAAPEQRRKEETRAGKKLAEKSVERQRMKIPSDYEKVIMRPQGGLERLMKFGGTYLADAISRAAGIGDEGAGDIITFNLKQQSVLIATGDEGKRNRYMAAVPNDLSLLYNMMASKDADGSSNSNASTSDTSSETGTESVHKKELSALLEFLRIDVKSRERMGREQPNDADGSPKQKRKYHGKVRRLGCSLGDDLQELEHRNVDILI
ncbi:hypothetical protein V5799_021266 [Amblyomma americanum]|uniref:Uncharacterized protein n=1 Tax=Amblyomma americanum TaxID=6943 RepID=A0AAQ4FQZ9_AMBAM